MKKMWEYVRISVAAVADFCDYGYEFRILQNAFTIYVAELL